MESESVVIYIFLFGEKSAFFCCNVNKTFTDTVNETKQVFLETLQHNLMVFHVCDVVVVVIFLIG